MMWAELLFFAGVLGLAIHQLHSVKKAQRKTAEEEAAKRQQAAKGESTSGS